MTQTEWQERSERIANRIAGQLRELLPADHEVTIRERENVLDVTPDFRAMKRRDPDAPDYLAEPPRNTSSRVVLPHSRIVTSHYIEVASPQQETPLVIIQVVSPADKSAGAGGLNYRRVRDAILNSDSDLVEIDRASGNLPLPLAGYTEERKAGQEIIVSAADTRPQATLWTIGDRNAQLLVDFPVGRHHEPVSVEVNNF